jgi:hypothetical protein
MSGTTTVIVEGEAVFYKGGFAINADGAPNAYHPSGKGLDYLPNAGRPGNWWGIVCNDSGVPITQGDTDPYPGYHVSTTALVDRSKSARDPARYVDSTKIPYASVAKNLLRYVKMGDLAVAVYRGKVCGAICADVGPSYKYGEGSIALADALGIPSSPRKGGVASGVSWILFPKTGAGWPRKPEEFTAMALERFDAWGGVARLEAALALP